MGTKFSSELLNISGELHVINHFFVGTLTNRIFVFENGRFGANLIPVD